MNSNESHQKLNRTVIANGFCIGCGACAVPKDSPFKVKMDEYGQYQSYLADSGVFAKTETNYEQLCPFGDDAPNEDELAKRRFSDSCDYNPQAGYFKGIYAGHVAEGSFRQNGSSGGMGTWIIHELLAKGLVDYVLHVKSEGDEKHTDNIPFKYSVSDTLEEIQEGAKSRYYPIQLSEVLQTVLEKAGRYAVVGLPCFIKSIRLLQAQDSVFAERISYCIGLVCGHLKSAHYAESLAWQMGISPEELKSIDFRRKDLSQPANRYNTYARGTTGEKVKQTSQLFGTDWGAGTFKYKACDFCDDVFAETADIVMGDAWLPEYVDDSLGTNIVVSRNEDIELLIQKACNEGRLEFTPLGVKKAIESQDAGLRHRKIGIIDRLDFERKASSWVPTKRVSVGGRKSSKLEIKKQELRVKMRNLSHESFKQAKTDKDINIYFSQMMPVYNRYKKIGLTLKVRLKAKVKLLIFKKLELIGYKRS